MKEESTRQVGRFGALQELSATFLLTIFLFFAHQRCITSFGQAETSLVYPSNDGYTLHSRVASLQRLPKKRRRGDAPQGGAGGVGV